MSEVAVKKEFVKSISNVYVSFLFNSLLWRLLNAVREPSIITVLQVIELSKVLHLLCGLKDTQFLYELYEAMRKELERVKSPDARAETITTYIHLIVDKTVENVTPFLIEISTMVKEVLSSNMLEIVEDIGGKFKR